MNRPRFSLEDIRQEVLKQGWVAEISGATIWRWLSSDALCPWRYRSWIFPRDLYQGLWEGKPLRPNEYLLSADEKTGIQVRRRKHPSLPPSSGRPACVEHEYERAGTWVYLAAWDVRRAKVFGRCEATNGIASFDRLVEEVMRQDP